MTPETAIKKVSAMTTMALSHDWFFFALSETNRWDCHHNLMWQEYLSFHQIDNGFSEFAWRYQIAIWGSGWHSAAV